VSRRLGQRLEAHGFKVECMRRSKEENLFVGQKGAAWVKTDHGIFEAWFLPSGQSFEKLGIKETVGGDGRYLYSFSGLSHVPPTLDSSQPMAFIEDGSVLFQVWGNPAFAAELRRRFSNTR
jgi:hypothetical protein